MSTPDPKNVIPPVVEQLVPDKAPAAEDGGDVTPEADEGDDDTDEAVEDTP